MKKLISSLFVGILFSIIHVNSTLAQVNLPDVVVSSSSSSTIINQKVSKSFHDLFKSATNVKWVEIDQRFVAKFIMDDQKNQAVFTKNGELVYHLTYGFEKNLPKEIRAQVKSKYFDYSITSAIHVSQEGRSIWLVGLEDSQYLISVRLEDGSMNEIERLTNITIKDSSASNEE
ncbi:hypothetical protein [Solitalea lacus]|uniref:hypothetical protein n=1 Tax=Solitalea lacus TaxID=2911172 RepID=UPI001EDA4094|nr:hypothetical protein [Solitalea lacus]UKJ06165.1 hypothetical protein L2B55_11505 [Solitalea lacus]